MEFGSVDGEGFSEEDHQMGDRVKLHYSNSSSSSHHQFKTQQLVPFSRWETTDITHQQIFNNQQQMGSWIGNNILYDPTTTTVEEEDNSNAEAALMESSPRNDEDVRSGSSVIIEKEHMFDKVVTPSDVGKLNRLVIPKQHAEKYFPLDSSTNEKGLLLNFEDGIGKSWRFRYSYWNSSQSYVMTKGWSRFVKDKKLEAGDIVSFQRGVGDLGKDRLFIDWRRRPNAPDPAAASFRLHHQYNHMPFHQSIPWNPLLMRPPLLPAMARDHSQINNFYNRNGYYNNGSCYENNSSLGSVVYLRSQPQAHMGMGLADWPRQQQLLQPVVFDSVPVVQGKAAAKRLRLFGVNMDCPITESDECDILSSTMPIQHSQLSSSSQLKHYNGTPLISSAALPPFDFLNKGKTSMSSDSDK